VQSAHPVSSTGVEQTDRQTGHNT